MANGKAFKKGEIAVHISRRSDNGEFQYQYVVVESCGAKKMTLSDAASAQTLDTKRMLGCDFDPNEGFAGSYSEEQIAKFCPNGRPVQHFCGYGTFKLMGDQEAMAFCLKLSAEWLAYEIESTKNKIDKASAEDGETPYVKTMRAKLAKLECVKPSAHKRG